MRAALAAAVVLSCAPGCGRIAFDARNDARGDGELDSDAAVDGAVDAAPLGPFGMPTMLDALSPNGLEDDPTVTADLLDICFESTRAGGVGQADIWCSARASATAAWSPPVHTGAINSTLDDEHPGLSADGLTLWFASNRPGGAGSYDTYVSTRATRLSVWTTPVRVVELSTTGNEEAVQVDVSGLRLVMATGPNSSSEDVTTAVRTTTASPWSTPALVSGVDINVAGATDSSPVLVRSGLALYFSSNRSGGNRIYVATRASTSEPFGPVSEITVPTISDMSDPWLTEDERVLYFHSFGRLYTASR